MANYIKFRNRNLCSIPCKGNYSFLPLSFGIWSAAYHISYPKETTGSSLVIKGTRVCIRPPPMSSFEIKNEWRHTFSPRYIFMARYFTAVKAKLPYLPPPMSCDVTRLCILIRTVLGTTAVAQLFKKSPRCYEIKDTVTVLKSVLRSRKSVTFSNIADYKIM
jgi:hypothetical protein